MKKNQVIVLGLVGLFIIVAVSVYFAILTSSQVNYAPKYGVVCRDANDPNCGGGGGGCVNLCSQSGARVCSNGNSLTCGNYDSDVCLEWGNSTSCGSPGCNVTSGMCNPQSTCTDTDGGYNFTVQGTVYGMFNNSNYSYTDYCLTQTGVMEYRCINNAPSSNGVSCLPLGSNYRCENGACVIPQTNQTHLRCVNYACQIFSGPGVNECSFSSQLCGSNGSLPDLTVTNITITGITNGSVINGTQYFWVNYLATIKNIGPGGSPYSYARIETIGQSNLDGVYTSYLDPGASTTISGANGIAGPGLYTGRVTSDYANLISESNEANNALTRTFGVP